MLRVRNRTDRIPHYPSAVGYAEVGVELLIDTRRSPFRGPPLRRGRVSTVSSSWWWTGTSRWWRLVGGSTTASPTSTPCRWRGGVHHDKNMVKGPDGRWVLEDRNPDYEEEKEGGDL
jgi:hypothetical protein